ncbi:MAG: hypothetical protein ABFD50_19560 [Smithella sp.]
MVRQAHNTISIIACPEQVEACPEPAEGGQQTKAALDLKME